MKKLIVFIILAMLGGDYLSAQDVLYDETITAESDNSVQTTTKPQKKKDLYFVYVACIFDNDENTTDIPIEALYQRLRNDYLQRGEYGNELIFYMSNGENPIIVKVNTKDDNRDDFDDVLISDLRSQMSNEINPSFDVDTILKIFSKNDFVNENGVLKYKEVFLHFYVTDYFWERGYGESLISKLHFTLDIEKIREENDYSLEFKVFFPDDERNIDVVKEKNFGVRNLNDMNKERENLFLKYN